MSNTYISTPTWNLVNTANQFIQQIISDATGQNVVATDGNLIYVSSDYGTTFSNGSSINNSVYFINNIAANASLQNIVVVIAPIFSGAVLPDYIYRSSDYGSTFSPLTNSPQAIWQTITSDATGQHLVAGQSDSSFLKLYYSTDYGTTWTISNVNDDCYWSSVVSSSDGSKVVAMGLNSQTFEIQIFTSTDYGENFTNRGSVDPNPAAYFNKMACSDTGQYVFITGQNGIYKSSDYGVSWSQTGADTTNNQQYYAISVDSTGQYVLVSDNYINNTYFSTDYGNTWTQQNMSDSNQGQGIYSVCISIDSSHMFASVYSVGIYDAHNSYPEVTGNTGTTGTTGDTGTSGTTGDTGTSGTTGDTGTSGTTGDTGPPLPPPGTGENGGTGRSTVPCFKEDTLILTDRGYVPIQDLRKGDLVKTFKNDYLPIDIIGTRQIFHRCSEERIKEQLYRLPKDKYKNMTEDLILTGCHSILVDCYKTKEQRLKTIEINGDTFVTDKKYRLPACADEKAEVYETPGYYNIYHLALENDDYYMNYGIYANGLLVESSSKRYITELSGMKVL
jgi:photosystem II stability/assembly factor-like uncharacterized protein